MTDSIAIVQEDRVKREAYRMGYETFEDTPPGEADVDGFRDGAEYTNHVLPKIRELSGYLPGAASNWTKGREAVAINSGVLADQPVIGTNREHTSDIAERVLGEWQEGAYDGAHNDDPKYDE